MQKCLAKNPDDRWQTARDLKSELVWVREGREDARRARAPVVKTGRRRAWRQLIAVGIPTLAALALAVVLWRSAGSAPPRTVARLSLNLPPGVTLYIPINGTSIAIAPDGSRIAFIGVRAGLPSLFIHPLDTGKTDEVADTRNAATPMFSADSQWVAFGQAGIIKKVPAAGGPVRSRRTWRRRPDGVAVGWAVRARHRERFAAPSEFPTTRPLTQLAEGEEGHLTPLLMRNGSLLFTSVRGGFLSSLNSIGVLAAGRPLRRASSCRTRRARNSLAPTPSSLPAAARCSPRGSTAAPFD